MEKSTKKEKGESDLKSKDKKEGEIDEKKGIKHEHTIKFVSFFYIKIEYLNNDHFIALFLIISSKAFWVYS